METNWPWNWRLTLPKTIKMVLVRPAMTNFKMSIRADYAISTCSPLSVSIKHLPPDCQWGEVGLWTGICPSHQLPASKIKKKFHQPCLFNGFWAVNSQISLSVTVATANISRYCQVQVVHPGPQPYSSTWLFWLIEMELDSVKHDVSFATSVTTFNTDIANPFPEAWNSKLLSFSWP